MLPLEVPVDVDREAAAAAAARELAKGVYAAERPPLWQRALTWVIDQVSGLLERAVGATPGGVWGLVVLALVVGAVLLVVLTRSGRPTGSSRGDQPLFVGRPMSAEEHRAAADRAAAAGQWAAAVRERFRAIVRTLEERGVLDERPGRTADEAAAEAGRGLPELAGAMLAAARLFDSVVYGQHPADGGADGTLRAVDERVRTARPVLGVTR